MATPTTETFVGRGEEFDALARVITSGVRLVTLVGPPGAGKTRLATEFCNEYEGSLFIDLTEAWTEDALVRSVAGRLDVPIVGARPLRQIGWALAEAQYPVIVLDNCEQILDVARRATKVWLEESDVAQFVVTSREALDLPAEIRISLGPLNTDDAVALFEERARAVVPDFSIGEEDRAVVAELLEALDNLPLVVELAAARVDVLPPAQLLRRLSDRLAVVRDQSRGTQRQASLRGAIDWSWEMLDDDQRRALVRSSVFRGGFSLEAAEALLDVPSPIDAVESLVRKSLIRRSRSLRDSMDVRFRPYESVRAYADSRLSEPERVALADEHARWYAAESCAWAEPLVSGGGAAEQVDALDRIGEEYANLQRAVENGGADARAEAALALDSFLEARGPTAARCELLCRAGEPDDSQLRVRVAVARAEAELARGEVESAWALVRGVDTDDSRSRAELELTRSRLARVVGRVDDARQHATEVVDAALDAGLGRLEALGRANLAAAALAEPELADDQLRRALQLASRSGDARLQLQLRNLAGTLAMNSGDLVAARSHFERALPSARGLGDHRVVAALLSNIGLVDHYGDRLDSARDKFTEAQRVFRRVGLRQEAAIAAGNRAAVEIDLGDFEHAFDTIHESLEAIGGSGTHAEAIVLATAGNLYHVRGNLDRAIARYDRALENLAPGTPHVASTRVYRALAALQRGEGEAEVESLDCETGHTVWDYAGRTLRALVGAAEPAEPPAGVPGQLRDGIDALRRLVRGEPVNSRPRWLFARLVAEWVGSEERPEVSAGGRAEPDLVVDANGFWFRVDDEEVDIRRRGPARLLLMELVNHPGQAFDLGELFEIGWPEQGNIDPEAADKRVYAAIGTLRKLGLGELIITTDQGYLLDPSIEVVVQGESA